MHGAQPLDVVEKYTLRDIYVHNALLDMQHDQRAAMEAQKK